ncbi:MAG TPA: hypothetical protein VM553_08665 [Dongiaceae bacterium]|nr:hypothetical protein [Dongiaceae bacterium]
MNNDTLDYLDDIEIYVESNDLEPMLEWLSAQFDSFTPRGQSKKGSKFNCVHQDKTSEGMIVLNAGRTGFASIWINSRHTPWSNDVEMARAAFSALKKTVRCNESAWSKGDDPDRWLQIDASGEHIIQWVTEEE